MKKFLGIVVSIMLVCISVTSCKKQNELKIGYANWVSTSWEVEKFRENVQSKLGDSIKVKLVAFDEDVFVAQAFKKGLVDVIFTEDGTIGGEPWANIPFENGHVEEYMTAWKEYFKKYDYSITPTEVWYFTFYTTKESNINTIEDLREYGKTHKIKAGCPIGYYDRSDNQNCLKAWSEYSNIKIDNVVEMNSALMLKAVSDGDLTFGFSVEALPLIYDNLTTLKDIKDQSFFCPQNYVVMCHKNISEDTKQILFKSLIPSTMEEFTEWYKETYGLEIED